MTLEYVCLRAPSLVQAVLEFSDSCAYTLPLLQQGFAEHPACTPQLGEL